MKQNKILSVALQKTKDTNSALSEFLAKNKLKNQPPHPLNESVDTLLP